MTADYYRGQRRHLWNQWLELDRPPLRTVCEVAVGPHSLVAPFSRFARKLLLVEPDPGFAAAARAAHPAADVREVAIGPEEGTRNLRVFGGSSYLTGVGWAPVFGKKSKGRIKSTPKKPVKVVPFGSVDDGEIDILNLDCEGSEWHVLADMRSRPFIIQVELYKENANHDRIVNWLDRNGYFPAREWGNANKVYVRPVSA